MLNGKVTIILLKKDIVQMSEYFPKPKSLCNVNLMKKKYNLNQKWNNDKC